MKRLLILLVIPILSSSCFAQISFEKGYFINNNGERINCFIKNIDWKNNPTDFKYQYTKNSEVNTATIEFVKEFEITNGAKYQRYTVNLDRSPNYVNNGIRDLTYDRNPLFNKEQIFLKVLVEGQASLYQYEDGNIIRFFYNVDNSNPEQLVFKNFRTPENEVGENNLFRQQLLNTLKCSRITVSDLEEIDYRKQELVSLFINYNQCTNSDYVDFDKKKKKKDLFNLTIRPGLNNSSFTVVKNNSQIDFMNASGFRLGIENEFILNFNKNKWSFILEPIYQSYKSEIIVNSGTATADYKSVDLAAGLRYASFLSERSKLFINAGFVLSFSLNSGIIFENQSDIEIVKSSNLFYGLGYDFDKFCLEIRYNGSRGITDPNESNYQGFSFIFGYTVF